MSIRAMAAPGVNEVTTDEIVKLVEVDGEEWLFYTATKIDVAFIRGTSAGPGRQHLLREGGSHPRLPGPGHGRAKQWRHRHRAGGAHRR